MPSSLERFVAEEKHPPPSRLEEAERRHDEKKCDARRDRGEYDFKTAYDEPDDEAMARKLRGLLRDDAKDTSGRGSGIRQVFNRIDANNDGSISGLEFRRACRTHGFDLCDREIQQLIRRFDVDGDGTISFLEFESFVEANEVRRLLSRSFALFAVSSQAIGSVPVFFSLHLAP